MTAKYIDEMMMRHALTLAHRGLGHTWPNPSVGAVIWQMQNGEPVIVGRGYTQKTGRPHAETEALAMAGDAARGAAIAVTLEPCAHHGKTPPCAEALVKAGIAHVVTALEDPDPRVSGEGHRILRDAGISVTTDVLKTEAERVNQGFLLRVREQRPFITLKLAQTADGFAGADGKPLMISCAMSKHRVHLARASHDAIMVGVGTVIADDPDLTCRLPGMMHLSPIRIIIDTHLDTPSTARVIETAAKVPTWIVTAEDAPLDRETNLKREGVQVIRVQKDSQGHVDIKAAMHKLAEIGITRIFSEGGPTLAEALVVNRLVDCVEIITSPEALGRAGTIALRPALKSALADQRLFVTSPPHVVGRDHLQYFERVR